MGRSEGKRDRRRMIRETRERLGEKRRERHNIMGMRGGRERV